MAQDLGASQIAAVVRILKGEPAEQFPERFANRWEEIRELTLMNLSINRK